MPIVMRDDNNKRKRERQDAKLRVVRKSDDLNFQQRWSNKNNDRCK